MLYFSLPNFWSNYKINKKIINLSKTNPEYFHFTVHFMEEGNLPFFHWNGGNNFNSRNTSIITREVFKNILTDSSWTPFIIDCSNNHLELTDLFDIRNNAFLDELNNGSNMIIVGNDMMKAYVKTYYPEYRLIASEEYAVAGDENIYLARVYPEQASALIKAQAAFLSLCCGSSCWKCSNRESCYDQNQQEIALFIADSSIKKCSKANFELLPREEIEQYIKQGISHFYLDVRALPNDAETFISIYTDWLIKDEYKETVGKELELALCQK